MQRLFLRTYYVCHLHIIQVKWACLPWSSRQRKDTQLEFRTDSRLHNHQTVDSVLDSDPTALTGLQKQQTDWPTSEYYASSSVTVINPQLQCDVCFYAMCSPLGIRYNRNPDFYAFCFPKSLNLPSPCPHTYFMGRGKMYRFASKDILTSRAFDIIACSEQPDMLFSSKLKYVTTCFFSYKVVAPFHKMKWPVLSILMSRDSDCFKRRENKIGVWS